MIAFHSPIGPLGIVVTERGIEKITFDAADAPVEDTAETRALAAYFAGDADALDRLTVYTEGTPFQQAVWTALRAIPCGATMTYGGLASRLGSPGAARAVGSACHNNPIAIVVPCHRVVGSNGKLTGYAGGLDKKKLLLDHERALAGHDASHLPLFQALTRARSLL